MEGVARADAPARPRCPLTAVRMARKRMYFSAAKAVRELGLPQTARRARARGRGGVVRRSTAMPPAARAARRVNAGTLRLAPHPQEPLELLLRVPLPAPRPARGASTPSTPSAASWTTRWTWAWTATTQRAELARWREEIARVLRRGAPEHPAAPAAAGGGPRASRSRARRSRRSSREWRWTSTARLRDLRRRCTRTAIGWPPRSGSAASRSSATRTRGRATTPSTSGSRSSSPTSSATSRWTRASGASTSRRRTCGASA